MARDGMSKEQALRRIRSQMPLSEKLRRADVIIPTTGSRAQSADRVRVQWGTGDAKGEGRHMMDPSNRTDAQEPVRRPRSQTRRNMLAQSGYYPTEETAETPVIPREKSGGWNRKKLALWVGLGVVLVIALFWGAMELSRYIQLQNELRAERLRLEELAREKARHPFLFRSLVEDYSSEQGLDPALVAAMILKREQL